eukprot:988750-Rhodomonas_salina.1
MLVGCTASMIAVLVLRGAMVVRGHAMVALGTLVRCTGHLVAFVVLRGAMVVPGHAAARASS